MRDYNNAEKYLQKVVATDRMHLKANYMLSHIYYEWKDYKRVLDHLDAIWHIADNREFINKYYGFCCFHLGRYDEAVKHLKEAILQHPEYEKFRNYLENLTYESKIKEIGDLDRAITELEKVMMNSSVNLTDVTSSACFMFSKGKTGRRKR
jgi:tetratricopeptide (TPR) repeat protein